ncbi:Uncharacterised protein [Streptococcus pneumoniae]|nr:Uncharacterised protein [Streptococcus pneumoniae]
MKMLVKYLILCYSESMDFFSRMILDILIAITCSFNTFKKSKSKLGS